MQVVTGLELRFERESRGIRQKALARAAGRRPEWVSRLEARRHVPAEQADLYRAALATFATSATSDAA
jgi:transcriptional regulator with XRE-family HTH domain